MLELVVSNDTPEPPILMVDYPGGTFVTGTLGGALSFIAKHLNLPPAEVTEKSAAEAGFIIRKESYARQQQGS